MTTTGGTRLEDVLDSMLAQFGAPHPAAVAALANKHPEHRTALMEFAASWAEEEHLPQPPSAFPEELVGSAARADFSRALSAEIGVPKLGELVRSAGLTLQEVARRCGLDSTVLVKLDAGRIAPSSAGSVLPRLIGRILDVSAEAVQASFGARTAAAAPAFLSQSRFLRTETLRDALAAAGTPAEVVERLQLPQ